MAQHAQTPKEKCFESAVDELTKLRERHGKTTPEIDHQRAWTRNADNGEWRPEPEESTFWKIIGSLRKTLDLIARRLDPTEDPETGDERWATGQPRFPDVTVTTGEGKKVVIDTKFNRADGQKDQWGTRKGVESGKDQKSDYNQINEQQSGRSDQDLSLDADTCECKEEAEPVEEMVPEGLGQRQVTPLRPELPNMPKVPEMPELPGFPEFPPIPLGAAL